jgi:hypothetical protein
MKSVRMWTLEQLREREVPQTCGVIFGVAPKE